jgi:hypothetical protein
MLCSAVEECAPIVDVTNSIAHALKTRKSDWSPQREQGNNAAPQPLLALRASISDIK